MGYLAVLHVRLGANFRDLHAKGSSLFCKRLIKRGRENQKICQVVCQVGQLRRLRVGYISNASNASTTSTTSMAAILTNNWRN